MRLPVIIINDCWEYIIELELELIESGGGLDIPLGRCENGKLIRRMAISVVKIPTCMQQLQDCG